MAGPAESFAAYALRRMPDLARRLSRRDVADWLAAQTMIEVDGEQRWLIDGDRLADAAEMKLAWARRRDLVDPARLAALEEEFGRTNTDVEAVEIAPLPGPDNGEGQ